MKTRNVTVSVEKIECVPEYYPRVNVSEWQTVIKYAEAMSAGAKFPPLHVVRKGGKYILLDGWNRTQAYRKAKIGEADAIEYVGLPEADWFLKAVELNSKNAKPFTVQDRAMIAYRLKQRGILIDEIAKFVSALPETVQRWCATRIVEGDKPVALKGAMKGALGTVNERAAVEQQGPVTSPSVLRTLDELLALLAAGQVDATIESVRMRLVKIAETIEELVGAVVKV